jgi:hypothetical protein
MSLKPSGPRGAFVPAAPKYDGRSRDWSTDSTGRHESLHPVDSGVQHALFVQKGELTSSPTTGNDLLTRVTDLGGPRQHEQVVAAIQQAQPIARFLQEGKIEIQRIEDQVVGNGGLEVWLYYRNLVTNRDVVASNSRP